MQVNLTVTTDDEDVRKAFEPGCPSNPARLKAAREIGEAGVQTAVTMTPLLLVSDPEAFADSLLETGAERFIVQPFHFQTGKFVAQTRQEAFNVMAGKLGCGTGDFRPEYLERYRKAVRTLKRRLPRAGEGKKGFAPPF